MYKNIMQMAAAFILLACAANSVAFAQIAKADPVVGAFFYNGTETSSGVFDPNSAMRYGNTFVLNSTGEWETHHLTVSLDYYASLPNGGNALTIMSGTWSLVKYDNNGQYKGTLYGEVTGGVISFVANGKLINAQLKSKGYLSSFSRPRIKIIEGTLEITTETNSSLTSGTLNLDF